jgi:hypothetical protein
MANQNVDSNCHVVPNPYVRVITKIPHPFSSSMAMALHLLFPSRHPDESITAGPSLQEDLLYH